MIYIEALIGLAFLDYMIFAVSFTLGGWFIKGGYINFVVLEFFFFFFLNESGVN